MDNELDIIGFSTLLVIGFVSIFVLSIIICQICKFGKRSLRTSEYEYGQNIFIIPRIQVESSPSLQLHEFLTTAQVHHYRHVHVHDTEDHATSVTLPTYTHVTQNIEAFPSVELISIETPPPNYEDVDESPTLQPININPNLPKVAMIQAKMIELRF